MTMEDLQQVIGTAVAAALGAKGTGRGGEGERRGELGERNFRRMDIFGADGEWKEWYFNFGVQVKGANKEVAQVMGLVENLCFREGDLDVDGIKFELDSDAEAVVDKFGGELYVRLCELTKGEPNTVIRSVAERCGFVAWKKLYDRYNPRTPARALHAMMGVMRPKEITDGKKIGRSIDEWEMKVSVLKRDFGEEVSESMKLAIFVGMMPRDIQEMVYQGMGSAKLDYKTARDKVRSLVEHRANMARPVPMHVNYWGLGGCGGDVPVGGYSSEAWGVSMGSP